MLIYSNKMHDKKLKKGNKTLLIFETFLEMIESNNLNLGYMSILLIYIYFSQIFSYIFRLYLTKPFTNFTTDFFYLCFYNNYINILSYLNYYPATLLSYILFQIINMFLITYMIYFFLWKHYKQKKPKIKLM